MSSGSPQAESAEIDADRMGTLVAVNVGMPKDVSWQGKTVFTGVFKDAVSGPRRVRKLNIDGDGQGDLAGHGGEQRAVFVYQLGSYRYWERELGREDFVYGQFGENFTVEGLSDDEVCIGDRYQIGSAVFEVTQPRVTCYRVGVRMNDPRIPALLVSHRGRRAPLPPRAPATAAAPSAPNPGAERRLASIVPRPTRRRTWWWQRRSHNSKSAPGLARVPPTDRHGDRVRKRLRDLHPARGALRRAAASGNRRPVPHGADPARQRAEGDAPQLLPLGTA